MKKEEIGVVVSVFFIAAVVLVIFYGPYVGVYVYSKCFGQQEIANTAREIASNETDTETILNRIADWQKEHMVYDTRQIYNYPVAPFLLWRQVHPDASWIMTIKRGGCEEYAVLFNEIARSASIQSRIVYNLAEDHVWCEVVINGSWRHFDPGLPKDQRLDNPGIYERSPPEGWGKQLSYVYFVDANGEENDITKTYTNTGRLTVKVEKNNGPVENARVSIESRFLMETRSSYKEPLFCLEKYTNKSGSCTFELGGNNYTVIAEYGSSPKYRNESIIQLIENSDVSATLLLSEDSPIGSVQVDESTLRLIDIVTSPIFILISVYVGWYLAKRTEKARLKVQEIRNELEKAYGPLYSIVNKPEKLIKTNGSSEKRVVISEIDKANLDEILTSYPHMFTNEIIVLWRSEIRDAFYHLGIPVKFKETVTKEYANRLEEYYKVTGRNKSLKGRPKWSGP